MLLIYDSLKTIKNDIPRQLVNMAEMKNAENLEGAAEGPSKCGVWLTAKRRMRHSGAPETCAEDQTETTPVTPASGAPETCAEDQTEPTPVTPATQNKTTKQGFLSPVVISRGVLTPPPTPRKPQPAKSRVPYKVGRCV